MPFIHTVTNVKLTEENTKALKESFGKAIELIRGKSERWLMLDFAGGEVMYFAGSDAPCAILEVKIFGAASDEEYDALTRELCRIVGAELGIKPERIYVKYDEVYHWGYDGVNF